MARLFNPGKYLFSPDAYEATERTAKNLDYFLARHLIGDWGVVCDETKAANEAALMNGSRIISEYLLSSGKTLRLVTEPADNKGHRDCTVAILLEDGD